MISPRGHPPTGRDRAKGEGEVIMQPNPQDRWRDLSEIYASYHASLREGNRAAAGLAKALCVQLENYLGGGDTALFEYDDEAGTYARQDDPMLP
jgi:hypothetical protein